MFLNKPKKIKQYSGLEAIYRKKISIESYPAADPKFLMIQKMFLKKHNNFEKN
jgi:hypothetical protein